MVINLHLVLILVAAILFFIRGFNVNTPVALEFFAWGFFVLSFGF